METFLEKTQLKRGRLAMAERLAQRWPNAMSLDFASQYLCMSEHDFRQDKFLMWLGFDMGGRQRWAKADLDRYIEKCVEARAAAAE